MPTIETILTPKHEKEESLNNTLLWASRPGAFVLYYPNGPVAWVGYGKSVAEGISRSLRLLDEGNFGGRFSSVYKQLGRVDLTFRVEFGEPRDAYIKLWRQYKEQGYTIMSKSPSIWRIVEVPIRDPRPGCYGFLLALYYENQSGRRILAGVFDKVDIARKWVSDKFPKPNYILDLIFKQDNLSKEIRKFFK